MMTKEASTKIVNFMTLLSPPPPRGRGSCAWMWPYRENTILSPLLPTQGHGSGKLSI